MPLLRTNEIRERKREKTMLVLRFLRTTIYSTAEILGMVMRLRDRSHAYMTLKALEHSKLIQSVKSDVLGGKTLWGITLAGQRFCLQDGDEENTKFFNPAKISSSTLEHYLDIQRIHIALEKAGWKSFEYPDKTPRPHLKGGQLSPENQYTSNIINADLADVLTKLMEFAASQDIEIQYSEKIAPAKSTSFRGVIRLLPDMQAEETVLALVREMAIQLLYETQRRSFVTRDVLRREVHAVVFVVCHALGLMSEPESIELYQGNLSLFSESLEVIKRTASIILGAISPRDEQNEGGN